MSSKSGIALAIRRVSKSYTIAHNEVTHATLAEATLVRLKHPFRRERKETFWALKDVSCDIKKGEIVGIIGRNGAGKSTLLKVLSRITEPTKGEIDVYGRVGSLLEVGTGFHPELTGRENIYLNGAILGMKKIEIKRQFDAIVDFADVEQFLDTPVKRYSSGMYVRLAFAVAAHLDSEILVVDEVLAVGDVQFQRKCLGKMGQVAKSGRTVLFVSHNMNAVTSLCSSVLRLERGMVAEVSSDVRAAVNRYASDGSELIAACEWRNTQNKFVNPWFHPTHFYLGNEDGILATMPQRNDEPSYIYIKGAVAQVDDALNVGYAIFDQEGTLLYWSATTDTNEEEWPRMKIGSSAVRRALPLRLLNQGKYRLELIISLYHRQWLCRPSFDAPAIEIVIEGGLSDSPYWMERRPGLLGPVLPWEIYSANSDETSTSALSMLSNK